MKYLIQFFGLGFILFGAYSVVHDLYVGFHNQWKGLTFKLVESTFTIGDTYLLAINLIAIAGGAYLLHLAQGDDDTTTVHHTPLGSYTTSQDEDGDDEEDVDEFSQVGIRRMG